MRVRELEAFAEGSKLLTHLPVQPCFCHCPSALDGRFGNAKDFGGLRDFQAGKKTQLDDAGDVLIATDKPVVGDYDADGRADQAVYRNGQWHLNRSARGYAVFLWGVGSDIPVVGDYDGDSKSDLAVYRNGAWWINQSMYGFHYGYLWFTWGTATDIPVPADYDGDAFTDFAVFRDGKWYIKGITGGTSVQSFGLAGDKPLQASYVP
jgi:hypothetical protein